MCNTHEFVHKHIIVFQINSFNMLDIFISKSAIKKFNPTLEVGSVLSLEKR